MGLFFALNAAIFSTAKDIISKKVSFKVSGTVSTIASFAYAIPFYLFALALASIYGYETWAVTQGFLALVILRAVSDCGAEWLKMVALSHGDLSLITAFYSLSPVFLLIASPIITGDPLTKGGIFGVILVTLGSLVFVYNRKSREGVSLKGILLALGASVFFALNSCFDRLAVQESSPLLAGFSMTLLSGVLLIPWAKEPILPAFKKVNNLFWLRGLLETIFMVSKLIAISFMQAPHVVAIMRLSILLSIISGRIVFKEQNFLQRFLGGLLMVIGVGIILAEELLFH